MIRFIKIFLIIIISINGILLFGKTEYKNIKNDIFSIKIPKNWEIEIENNKYFSVVNYSEEEAERIYPDFNPDWTKFEFYYGYKSNSSLENELKEQLKIHDVIFKQEKIKLKNGKYAYSVLADGIPNENSLFIVYYDGFKSVVMDCWPSTTKYIKEFYEIVKSFSFIYYTPTTDNLRFRESPGAEGKFIRSLIKGEKLELVEKGAEETINGVKGNWVKVRTSKGEEGWCFDGYLEAVN